MQTEMIEAIAGIAGVTEPDREMIVAALAKDLCARIDFDTEGPVEAGIAGAIEEIDDVIFDYVVEAVQLRVHADIEADAKRIALQLLRELAAQARHEEAAAS